MRRGLALALLALSLVPGTSRGDAPDGGAADVPVFLHKGDPAPYDCYTLSQARADMLVAPYVPSDGGTQVDLGPADAGIAPTPVAVPVAVGFGLGLLAAWAYSKIHK